MFRNLVHHFNAAGRQARERALSFSLRRASPILISDGNGWVLDDFCRQLTAYLELPSARVIDFVPDKPVGKTIHFVDRYRFFSAPDRARLATANRVIVTWWHGGDSAVRHVHLDGMLERLSSLAALPVVFHVTSSLYVPLLQQMGIAPQRIIHLPMGVDLPRFTRSASRAEYRRRLGVPPDAFVIGSFQRDGDEEPKLVKGPDILVESMRQIADEYPAVYVLLTGTGRGYVSRRLAGLGIPFHYAGKVPDTAPYYLASDLYLITSREEGGPAAVLESMAAGTPLVSTRVGMAVDVIEHGQNGFLAPIEDAAAITAHALTLINSPELRERVSRNALETAQAYGWPRVAPRYRHALYGPPR